MNKYQKILGSWSVPEGKSTEQAWQEMEPRLKSTPARETRVVKMTWKPLAGVAAAAAVLIMAVVFVWPKSRVIRTVADAGQVQNINLPDQSHVTLNAGSTIEYGEDWSEERALKLEGQAFFQVQKGSKFSVHTPNGVVEVLGTSFDVFARPEKFRVECRTGKVRVSTGKEVKEITPGEAAELENGILEVISFDSNEKDWQTGEFNFEGEPLSNALKEIERQYNVEISAPDLPNALANFDFNKSQHSLKDVLVFACQPSGLDFKIEGNKVIITKKEK